MGALCGNKRQLTGNNALEESLQVLVIHFRSVAGSILLFLNRAEAESPLWFGIWRWMKTPRGQSMCESYDPGFGLSHTQTQTDQSGLETKACNVLFLLEHEREEFCINLFILFYEAVTASTV